MVVPKHSWLRLTAGEEKGWGGERLRRRKAAEEKGWGGERLGRKGWATAREQSNGARGEAGESAALVTGRAGKELLGFLLLEERGIFSRETAIQ